MWEWCIERHEITFLYSHLPTFQLLVLKLLNGPGNKQNKETPPGIQSVEHT